MSTQANPHVEDEKIEAYQGIEHRDMEQHPDMKGREVHDAFDQGQVATGYENLSIPQTIMRFKMAVLVCFLATFAAATDGYQSELPYQSLVEHC